MENQPGQAPGKPDQSDSLDEAASARPEARAARTGRTGAAGDAPPSNTASHTCNDGDFKPLRWGVDSLYLSYPGELDSKVDDKLKKLKQIAQAQEAHQRAAAQFPVEGHLFEVKDKGAPLFPYVLEDGAFRIQLSRSSKSVPMAYVKLSSTYLAHAGPVEAEQVLRKVLQGLGTLQEAAKASRIDLFVDFVSSVDMESWGREAWVTRAASINAYSVDGKFSGWSVGLGGDMACRLYDKTLEISVSKKAYLHDLWRQAGWDGACRVWRLEFQFKRTILTQHGLSRLNDVLAHLNGLWDYATTGWLRLTLPNPDDQTRSRWPVHPLWGYLASVDWETPGGPLSRQFSPARVPGDDKLFSLALSLMVSYMAREGLRDFFAGQEAFLAALYQYHADRAFRLGLRFDDYIAEKVSIKAREFNSMLNPLPADEVRVRAERYRRESDGA